MPPAFNLSFSVSLPVKLVNWSNGSQGISRVAMLRKSRIRKSQRGIAKIAVGAKVRAMGIAPDMWLPIVVTMTRVSPRAFDDDGLRSALKAIRDGIADVFGIGDATPLIEWRYEQRRGGVREYGVEIFVRAETQ